MDEILTSNEQNLLALEGTVKLYNIVNDGQDDLPLSIKFLRAVTRSIIAMRADGSNRNAFSDLFVIAIIGVLQTTGVQPFNDKMKQFHDNIEFERFKQVGGTKFSVNTPAVLKDVYEFTLAVHTEMFNVGTWQEALTSKPKSSFTTVIGNTIYWKNRCWNYDWKDGTNIDACNYMTKQSVTKMS